MQVAARLRIENDLHQALARGEFRLYFQPITPLPVAQWFRWRRCCAGNTLKGLLSPAEFISIAEETGLIVPIGIWVIEETRRLAKTWSILRDAGLPLGIAVNLSARQLIQSDFSRYGTTDFPCQRRRSNPNRIWLRSDRDGGDV